MSETITPETDYPPLSEATDNDVRDDAVQPEAPVEETPPEPVADSQAPPEVEAEPEDDLAARNARLARQLREQKRLARQLSEQAATLQGQRQEQPNEAMEREINLRAQQLAQAQVVNTRANEVYTEGVKAFGRAEFDESVKTMNEAFGPQVIPIVIDTLIDIPNAPQLIQYLADNPDIADDLANLPPHKLGAALARESNKIATPKPKPVSKAPPPIRPIAVQPSNEGDENLENLPMEKLAALWDKRDFDRRFR